MGVGGTGEVHSRIEGGVQNDSMGTEHERGLCHPVLFLSLNELYSSTNLKKKILFNTDNQLLKTLGT